MSTQYNQGSIVAGALWMVLLSILLFWLPVIGPLIAGFVGGRVAGSVSNALWAALLPAIVVAILVFIIGTAFGLPLIGAITGTGLFLVVVAQAIPVIIGAVIGGALA